MILEDKTPTKSHHNFTAHKDKSGPNQQLQSRQAVNTCAEHALSALPRPVSSQHSILKNKNGSILSRPSLQNSILRDGEQSIRESYKGTPSGKKTFVNTFKMASAAKNVKN